MVTILDKRINISENKIKETNTKIKKYDQSNYISNSTQQNIRRVEKIDFLPSIDTNLLLLKSKANTLINQSLLTDISNPVINQDIILTLQKNINQIKEKYIIKNYPELEQCLLKNIKLISILLEADQEIKKIFTEAKLVLKFLEDPEIFGFKELGIAIHINFDVDEAFDKLKLLEHNWWLDFSLTLDNNLDIYIDFDEI